MDCGQIADVRMHAELVSRPDVYQDLYNEHYRSAHERALEALFCVSRAKRLSPQISQIFADLPDTRRC